MKLLVWLAIGVIPNSQGDSEICYSGLGCFDNDYPWSSSLRPVPLPASPEDVDTHFYFFPNSKADPINVTTKPNISFKATPFNPSWQTYFITHGFTDTVLGKWSENMSRAIAAKGQVNVLAVDWSKGAKGPNYFAAASNTRTAGAEISRVIKYMISDLKVFPTDIHLIGHSLGAHVCAYASNGVGGIYEITGLDSAQPLFEGYDNKVHLDKSDACVVYGLHTDARPFIPFLGFGFVTPFGDIDSYVNGGVSQPGCNYPSPLPGNETLLSTLALPIVATTVIACPHSRAHIYYLETIVNSSCIMWNHKNAEYDQYISTLVNGNITTFPNVSTNCSMDSCIPIGLNATDYPANRLFLSRTHNEYPFCVLETTSNSIMASSVKAHQNSSKYDVCAAKGIKMG